MFFVVKNDSVAEPQPVDSPDTRGLLGRCRRNAPTMKGFPAVFQGDWCGEHKLDGSKI